MTPPRAPATSSDRSMPPRLWVDILDDDVSHARALAQRLSVEGYRPRVFAGVDEFLSRTAPSRLACAVLEARVGGQSGLEVWDSMRASGVQVPVIFLTRSRDIATCVQAMRRGAVDFLTKPAGLATVLDALHRAEAFALRWRSAQSQRVRVHERMSRLTPRERDVLTLVLVGQRNKQIAARLACQESTVKVHRSRLMRKLEARSLAELLGLREHLDTWRPPVP